MGQQHGQGQDIGGVVGEQGFQDGRIAPALVFPPQRHGKVAVGPGQRAARHAVARFAFLEAALDTDAAKDAAQVDMGLGQHRSQVGGQDRRVKAPAVEGNKHLLCQNIGCEGLEVLAVGIGPHGLAPVVEGHGRDLVGRGAVGFDIDTGQRVTKIEKKTPGFGRGQPLPEIIGIAGRQPFPGLVQPGAPSGHSGRMDRQPIGLRQIVPAADASRPQPSFRDRAEAGQMQEGMLKHARTYPFPAASSTGTSRKRHQICMSPDLEAPIPSFVSVP